MLESLEYERTKVNYTWVRLYGYPLDSDSIFLQKTLTLYGELNSLIDEMDGRLQIKTGVKIAQFSSLKGNIPSFIHVGKHRLRTGYRGQTKTCRYCHQAGHEVKNCMAGKVCKQCGKPGHTKGDCPERICFHCLGKGHEANRCPKYTEEYPGLGASTEQATKEVTPIEQTGTTTNIEPLSTHPEIPPTTMLSTTKNQPTQAEPTTQSTITTLQPTQEPKPPSNENRTMQDMETEGQQAAETQTSQTENTHPPPQHQSPQTRNKPPYTTWM